MKQGDSLTGLSERDLEIMGRLIRTPPEQQKASPKLATVKGEAQRRRREKERKQLISINTNTGT
jgi:hypothetical protein